MRVRTLSVENFGSYKVLSLDFDNQGLTLVSGPTGSGKSTLCDGIPWVLFGVTSKGGKTDEIRSWNADSATIGVVCLEVNGIEACVYRTRKTKANDLYYHIQGSEIVRGKDIPDTQRLINSLLGIDADLYLSGAYFHEFSQAAQFFTTTAKNRRQITEQMADLKLVKTLSSNLTDYRKYVKKAKDEAEKQKAEKVYSIAYIEKALSLEQSKRDAWFTNHKLQIKALEKKNKDFESNKIATIEQLEVESHNRRIQLEFDVADLNKTLESDDFFAKKQAKLLDDLANLGNGHCDACGAPTEVATRMVIQKALHTLQSAKEANDRTKIAIVQLEQRMLKNDKALALAIEAEQDRVNAHGEQLAALRKETNPFNPKDLAEALAKAKLELQDTEDNYKALAIELSDLELLADLTDDFRTACLSNTIRALETKCNQLLTTYFDAEIKVKFTAEGADKLEVSIAKDGNECSYTQLSKGQRQLLKLSFGVAVMEAVSNFQGVKFEQIFIDEALDGLSDAMKAKAFKLLENLALNHENVFCIDHSSDFKLLFNRTLNVYCTNGESSIEEAY